jgi:hypothetical protein
VIFVRVKQSPNDSRAIESLVSSIGEEDVFASLSKRRFRVVYRFRRAVRLRTRIEVDRRIEGLEALSSCHLGALRAPIPHRNRPSSLLPSVIFRG